MGRKIPGRKHRGVRYPEKQQEQRYNSIKDKINAPPTVGDDEFIPKSLKRIMDLKERVKIGRVVKKRENVERKLPGKRPEKPVPVFKQRPGESDKHFVLRMGRACREAINEVKFEEKYGVEVRKDPVSGKVKEVVKKEKNELDYLESKRSKKKEKKSKKDSKLIKPKENKLSKSQKRSLKLKEKKLKKVEENIDGFKLLEDKVKFGEVVHAPPELIKPRKAKNEGVSRPGKRDLLLKSLLVNQNGSQTIDKQGKRKNLPDALRRQLDRQQSEVIEAYKSLKVKKYKQCETYALF